MSRYFGLLLIVGATLAWPSGLQRTAQIKYVLSTSVIVIDPVPDVQLPPLAERDALFQTKFETAFPGQVLRLGPDSMIAPDDRVIVLVPSITAARVTHEVKAGSIHIFETVIAGDMSALDPWSGATLYSATRMVTGEVSLGKSKIEAAGTEVPRAFRAAYDRWLDACIEQMKRDLDPFELNAATIPAPGRMRTSPGGIWPFGSERGVRQGATLTSAGGQFAQVTSVYPRFSVIRDIASSSRPIPAGETYSLTVVEKPAARPEPRIALSWVGSPLVSPPEVAGPPISSDAALSFFANYVSKSGGLRILTRQSSIPAVRDQLRTVDDDISRHSKLVIRNAMTIERESLVRLAAEAPEYKVELGILDSYFGSRLRPDGAMEHLFRVTFAAAIRRRTGSEETPVYPVLAVVRHTEEIAQLEIQGVREEEPASAWLTVSRNGVIRLAREVLDKIAVQSHGDLAWREGVVSSDRSTIWNGAPPDPTVPLTWLRTVGPVVNTRGETLGTYLQMQTPTHGFLNARVLADENLQPGDILRYEAVENPGPTLGLELTTGENTPAWLPHAEWIALLAAESMTRPAICGCQFAPVEGTDSDPAGFEKVLHLNLTSASVSVDADGMALVGQWRARIVPHGGSSDRPPLLKFGLEVKTRIALNSLSPGLSPPDIKGRALDYTLEALRKLADLGAAKNMRDELLRKD